MGRISWQTQQPGHFEVDLVDRCIIVVGVQQESTPTHCRWWRPQGGGHRVERAGSGARQRARVPGNARERAMQERAASHARGVD